jgi:proliferating cell nuclear antigen PCNA
MFMVCFPRADVLRNIAESVRDLVSDVVIEITADGLYLMAMDASAVAVAELRLPRSGFVDFQLDGSECERVGLSLTALSLIVKCFDGASMLELRSGFLADAKLHVTDRKAITFVLNTMDIAHDKMEVPAFFPAVRATLKSDLLKRLMVDVGVFGTRCALTCSCGVLKISFDGGDHGTAIVVVNGLEGCEDVHTDSELNGATTLSLRYMRMFTKGGSLGKRVVIDLTSDKPVRVSYAIDAFSGGSLVYYLAPQAAD